MTHDEPQHAVPPSHGLGWLADIQGKARADFAARGFPTTAEEDWRYTDLGEAARRNDAHADGREPGASPDRVAALADRFARPGGAAMVVFVDGTFDAALSRLAAVPGLSVEPLSHATGAARDAIAARLGRQPGGACGALAALNLGRLRDGLRIVVAPGAVIADPIYVAFGSAVNGAAQNRLLVELGAGSRATVVEQHVSLGSSLANSVTDVTCGPGSRLNYLKLQRESEDAIHLASQVFTVGAGARAHLLHLDLGALLGRNDLDVTLAGEGAAVDARGLFYADGARHLDNHTRIVHEARETTSRELYRGIVDGKGRGVFNGKVIVQAGAGRTDARLTSQNLLLSRTAELDTKPELEIYADDVKCSHGATTGQLDDNAIFYLRSRGIPADQARRMLIASFAGEIVRRVEPAAIGRHVLALLAERLPEVREFAQPS